MAERVSALTGLRDLVLIGEPNGQGFGDAGAAKLARLPRLRRLLMDGRGINDAGLIELGKLRELRGLGFIPEPGFSEASLRALAKLPQLRSVGLRLSSEVTAARLAPLTDLPRLRALSFAGRGGQPLSGAALEPLTRLPRLKFLRLQSSAQGLSEPAWQVLGRLTSLQRLELLLFKGVAPECLEQLRHLPRLRWLLLQVSILEFARPTEPLMRAITSLRALRWLSLPDYGLSDAQRARLRTALPGLRLRD
jgi:hypothetical protein